MSLTLAEFNSWPEARAAQLLSSCCGARRWVAAMVASRPYESRAALEAAADAMWRSLGPDDWREAFSHHPRIGASRAPTAATEQGASWSAREQALVSGAADSVRAELADVNADYERRFGFTYIVRAAGRGPEELLRLARERMENEPATELLVAAEQQQEITRLRLGALFGGDTS